MQFCLTLKTYCNQQNRKLEVLLPVNAVETYDAPNHSADAMQNAALTIMNQAGIKLTSEVIYHE